jgi:hypothetical protein
VRDAKGGTWDIIINVSSMRRVRDLVGVNLMDVAGGEILNNLSKDPVLFVDVLYAILKPQAEAKKITDEEFGESLNGDALDEASKELVEGLISFFPRAKGNVMRLAAERMETLTAMMLEQAEKNLSNLDLDSLAGSGSIDSPESVELTQESSP